MWSSISLTLFGKILVAESLGLSNLIHIMSNSSIKLATLQNIQKIVNRFIWSNKPAKIKHMTLKADYSNGGLRSPDILDMYKSHRLAWIPRILAGGQWTSILSKSLLNYCNFLFLLKSIMIMILYTLRLCKKYVKTLILSQKCILIVLEL